MGKSKRIRAERARDIATNPEKFASAEKKNNGSKKSKATSIIIIVLVAAILLAAIAATIIVNTGSVLRWQNAMSSENYTITGTMYSYIFYNIYNNYYSYFGNSITSLLGYIQSNAKSQAKQILALCEGAKAAGITLSDEDYATIDENIKNLEENLKTAGTNISAYFGNCGVSRDDVREVMILSTLASKYQEKKTEEFTSLIEKDMDKILAYIKDNKADFYKADYITYTTEDKAVAEKLAAITDVKEFKAEIIEILVNSNYVDELTSATSKFELSEKPVESLNAAIKATIIADLKYTNLQIEPAEGLDEKLDKQSKRADRIKTIFEALYGDTTFEKGENDTDKTGSATEMSDKLYTAAVAVADKIDKTVTTTFKNSVKEGVKYNLKDTADSEDKNDGTTAAPGTTEAPDATTAPEGSEVETMATETTGNTDTEKWIFDDARKTGDTTVLTVTTDKKTTYTALLCTKAMYLDEAETKDVGHILVKVETKEPEKDATDEEKKKIEEENEQKYKDAEPTAKKYLDEFLASGKTKEDFEKIGEKYTEDSNVFYENVREGEMVDKFDEWIFDEARKVGDTGIVKSEFGWHVMYFVGEGRVAYVDDAINAWVNDQWTEWFEAEYEKLDINDKLIGDIDGGSNKTATK